VYGFVTDPAGRVLLVRIADTYPDAGRWHLPGGGTDFGEAPADCLLRELHEEAGQQGRVEGIIGPFHAYKPGERGPEGPRDWHGVGVHYRVRVEVPTRPTVTEAAGGSTAQAAWFEAGELAGAALTTMAAAVVARQFG
jgi:ADP-ribose pyrophosphatase YjhB (NUDIX family)